MESKEGRGWLESNPLGEVDVELVEGDVCGGDEDFLDEGVDALENGEVEELRALLVQIRHHLPVLRHSDSVCATANPRILRVGLGWGFGVVCCLRDVERVKTRSGNQR